MLRSLYLALAVALLVPSAAGAAGLVRVQQSDGSVQEYPNARIAYSRDAKALSVTTADGAGTLTIDQAACSYAGELYRCLLTQMSVDNHGVSHPLDFDSGTLYANLTEAKLYLPRSTRAVPPRGIVMAIKTKRGTYISLVGTIDHGVK